MYQRAETGGRCQSPALRGPSASAGHVGFDPDFVNEDQSLGVKPVLMRLPPRTEPRHFRADLLAGHQSLFLTVWPDCFTNRQTVSRATCTPRAASSTVRARIVRSGFSASRANSHSPASPTSTGRRCPPIFPGACPRPARCRWPSRGETRRTVHPHRLGDGYASTRVPACR